MPWLLLKRILGVWGIFSVREAAEIFLEVVSFCLVILGRGKEKKSSFGCRVVGDRGSAVRGKWAEIFRGGGSCIEEERSFWKLQGGFLGFGGQGGEDFREIFLGGCF